MTNRRLIAVDIGNSATKVGWFDSSSQQSAGSLPQSVATKKFATGAAPTADFGSALPTEACDWRVVSVHRDGTRILTEWIAANRPHDAVQLLGHNDLPIAVRVEFPKRVGLDRLAAGVAANVIRGVDQPAIVIGAGSAITVN